MGLSIPNPINTVKHTVDRIGDAGKAVVHKTVNAGKAFAGKTVGAAKTTVKVVEATAGVTKDVAIGTLKFEASLTKFALNKAWDKTQAVASAAGNVAHRGVELAGRGLDKVSHPGFAHPPASQGLEFSETKSASELAYKRSNSKIGDVFEFPGGKQWRVADVQNDPKTGFRAVALKPVDASDKRTIVAFAGSDEGRDWDDNLLQGAGITPKQYKQAVDFTNKWKASDGNNVILTGHSLGGGLASYASIKTDLRATAVNSAPLALNHIGFNPLDARRITQYYVPGEVLTTENIANNTDIRPGWGIPVQGKDSIFDPRSVVSNHSLDHVAPDIPEPKYIGHSN